MGLKSHITTGFLALSALPAQAQELKPYTVTRECAIESLRGTFDPVAVDIHEFEEGVGGFVETGNTVHNSLIAIDPETGLVDWLDVQIYTTGETYEMGSAKLTYGIGQHNGIFFMPPLEQTLAPEATAFVMELDTRMRNCKPELLLG